MKLICVFFLILSVNSKSSEFIKKVFPSMTKTISIPVPDVISKNPLNNRIVKVMNGKTLLGFYRKLVTTTGCNSACLPITATLFYTRDKKFLTIKSKRGLTKKDHISFSQKNYQELELILNINPKSFISVEHPKDMVDVLTGETTKKFKNDVVKNAAYTTLRLNKYNQDTLKRLKGL